MSKRRLLFMVLFATGTALAALGWYAEWRLILNVASFILAGHAMQVIGLFGYILTPDAIVRIKDEHEESVNSVDSDY